MAWHRPFCVDLEESTFTYLRNFLESYCDGIENETPPAPFLSKRYVVKWTQLFWKWLCFIISVWTYGIVLQNHPQNIFFVPWWAHCITTNRKKDTCSPTHTSPHTPHSWCSVCVFLRDHHQFLLLCMRLLSIHLSLAHAGGTGAIVLGAQGRPLRNLLFRLIDTNMPDSIQQVN